MTDDFENPVDISYGSFVPVKVAIGLSVLQSGDVSLGVFEGTFAPGVFGRILHAEQGV